MSPSLNRRSASEAADSYPVDLAFLVRRQWSKRFEGESFFDVPVYAASDPLPIPAQLEQMLSTCYQASLMREEGRAVRFRLMLLNPANLVGDPPGLHAIPFAIPLPFTPNDLRRLSPAAAFERTLIAVRARSGRRFEIWGLIHSGEQWLRTLEGSRRSFPALPPALVVNVTGPGNLSVAKGSVTVARLLGGRLAVPAPGLLEASAHSREVDKANEYFLRAHESTSRQRGAGWARVNRLLISQIRRQTALRLLSAMRATQHGATLIILPLGLTRDARRWRKVLNLRYSFPSGPARRRLFTDVLSLIASIAANCGRRLGSDHEVTWKDYLDSHDRDVLRADEAITETVRFMACLSAVDGAVVIGQPLDLLGFGAEISGKLPRVEEVARALDASGATTTVESALNVGTRHRSAYRLCKALPGVMAAVISQDGTMRIAKSVGHTVIYSEHLGTGVLNL